MAELMFPGSSIPGEFVEGVDKVSALLELYRKDLSPVFAPAVILARIVFGPSESAAWESQHSLSLRIIGRPFGSRIRVAVYSHIPTSFGTPYGMAAAVKKGLVNGAAHFPGEEFDYLVNLAEEQRLSPYPTVFMVDNPFFGYRGFRVSAAVRSPDCIAFVGGPSLAEEYFPRASKLFDSITSVASIAEPDSGNYLARVLGFGDNFNYILYGNTYFSDNARFAGVRAWSSRTPAMGPVRTPLEARV
jgi:hypothetical protein